MHNYILLAYHTKLLSTIAVICRTRYIICTQKKCITYAIIYYNNGFFYSFENFYYYYYYYYYFHDCQTDKATERHNVANFY